MIKKIRTGLASLFLLAALAACGTATNETAFDLNRSPNIYDNANEGMMRDYDNDRDWRNVSKINRLNADPDISSTVTTISSDKYPHTKPIVVRHAEYSFRNATPAEAAEIQKRIEQELKNRFGKLTPQLKEQARQQAKQQINTNQQQTETKAPEQETVQENKRETNKQQPQKEQKAEQPQQPKQETAKQQSNISQFAQEVIKLTNNERAKQGLPALQADASLANVAQVKAEDMAKNNYFSHTSPTYGSPFDMMRDFGVSYKTAGENIAQGQRSPQEVVQAWMNSEGHRANIMNKNFTHIGIGYETSGNHWVQMFIGK